MCVCVHVHVFVCSACMFLCVLYACVYVDTCHVCDCAYCVCVCVCVTLCMCMCTKTDIQKPLPLYVSLAHILLEAPNCHQLPDLFVYVLFVALKKRIPLKICIGSV